MTADGIVKVLNALPTTKLIDTVSSGLGKAFEPRYIKKMAEARAYEINTIGEALRNNSDVIVVYENGNVIANTPEFEDFVKRTEHRLAHQELQKQYNIESVIGNAYIELETKETVSEETVSFLFYPFRVFSIFKYSSTISSAVPCTNLQVSTSYPPLGKAS